MKCLVVVSHPLSNSLCRFLADNIIGRLIDNGHDVVVQDLYALKFEPALGESERATYYGEYDTSQIDEQVRTLLEAEALVLVFPTWWFGFPAVLKGWFDRVWGPGIAYDHADDLGPIKPRLDNLKKVLAVTSLGAPWWVDRLVLWQPVKRILKYAILGVCTKKSKLEFLSIYDSENLAKRDVDRFCAKAMRVLDGW